MITIKGSVKNFIYGTCKRKATFLTEKAAIDKALSLHMRAYHCPICGFYHLTSQINKGDNEDSD